MSLSPFDIGFGILVLISAILATARGLTREVLSLITWAGSAALAVYIAVYQPDLIQKYVSPYIKDATLAKAATGIVVFIVALIILHLITMRIADFIVESRVGALDRTLGFVFGVLRGILIGVVVVYFGFWLALNQAPEEGQTVDTTQLPSWAGWAKNSVTLSKLEEWGGGLRQVLHDTLPDADIWLSNVLKRGSGSTTATDNGAATDDSGDQAPNDATTPNDTTTPDTGGGDTTTPAPAPAAPAPAGNGA